MCLYIRTCESRKVRKGEMDVSATLVLGSFDEFSSTQQLNHWSHLNYEHHSHFPLRNWPRCQGATTYNPPLLDKSNFGEMYLGRYLTKTVSLSLRGTPPEWFPQMLKFEAASDEGFKVRGTYWGVDLRDRPGSWLACYPKSLWILGSKASMLEFADKTG